ncbi:hypothetical protein Tco_1269561, partial [Tanacetum coccineum]
LGDNPGALAADFLFGGVSDSRLDSKGGDLRLLRGRRDLSIA